MGFLVQVGKQIGCGTCVRWIAVQGKHVASISNLDIEALLDLVEVFVKLPAKLCESTRVVGFQGNRVSRGDSVQMRVSVALVWLIRLRIAALVDE